MRRATGVRRASTLLLAVLLAVPAACSTRTRPRDETPAPRPPTVCAAPRLILLVVVDQARGDIFERFGPWFTGGLARLQQQGLVFTAAHHDHARTLTGPGHATLVSGRHPSHHGIIGNEWFERGTGEQVYCVEDDAHEVSPAHLLGSTLGDWLKASDPGSRVFAAAGKDRSAILMGGHRADGAYWYDTDTGAFRSSSYYPRPSPPWLTAFNARRPVERHFGRLWEALPLPDTPDRPELHGVDEGPYTTRLPRSLGRAGLIPDERFYDAIHDSPFLDEALAELAAELIGAEHLGQGPQADMLALGFSSADTVGHVYGLDSPEYLDTLLRLDAALGDLLDLLDRQVGKDGYLVALSSDHGVLPLPESPGHPEESGRRFTADDVACVQAAGRRLRERLGDRPWLQADGYLDRAVLAASGRDEALVERTLGDILEECDGVERVWTRSELLAETPPEHPLTPLVLHAFHPERSPDVFVQLAPGVLGWVGKGTTHGSPFPYDTHVPLILMLPGQAPGTDARPVHTVDLAPTLASFLGLPVPPDLDGQDLLPPSAAAQGDVRCNTP